MSNDNFLNISIAGDKRIIAKLEQLPKEACDAGVEQATNYLLGVLENKEIPPYKHVSRTEAYGKPFQTARQRRWFFAALRDGRLRIPYIRGGKSSGVQSKWVVNGAGQKMSLSNRSEGAFWIYDNQRQARQLGLVGWKKIGTILEQYQENIYRSFMRGVKKAIEKLGLQ